MAVTLLCLGQVVHAQTRIDLRHSHDVQQVLSTGVNYRETPEINGRKLITVEPSDLVFILPGGQTLQTRARYCAITSTADGKLRTLTVHGQILPDDEAYQVALKLHQAFSIPMDRLEQWKKDIVGKGRDAPTFSSGKRGYYPHIFLGMQSSMNTLYPWYLLIELGWTEEDDTRNEAWGETNNPRPPAGLDKVSLDSPSGRIYDRKDAYVHLAKAQEELDRKLGQRRDAQGWVISTSPPPSVPVSPPASPGIERSTTPLWKWGVILISLLIVLLILGRFLRR